MDANAMQLALKSSVKTLLLPTNINVIARLKERG